jgi:hypothetical protein
MIGLMILTLPRLQRAARLKTWLPRLISHPKYGQHSSMLRLFYMALSDTTDFPNTTDFFDATNFPITVGNYILHRYFEI